MLERILKKATLIDVPIILISAVAIVSIWRGATIHDFAFIGPNAVFTNDLVPRAKIYRKEYHRTIVQEGASVGANATLVCPVTIGRYALVGAGSVVTKDVPDYSIVYGSPARFKGWICTCGERLEFGKDEKARCGCGIDYLKEGDVIREMRR